MLPCRDLQGLHHLFRGDRLTGEGGLLDLEGRHLEEPPVGRHRVAGFQQHHVARHQLFTGQDREHPVPQHLAGGGGHLLQGLDSLLGLALLIHAQDGVQQHHRENDDHIGVALAFHITQYTADGGRRQQNEDHGIGQLFQEAGGQGLALGLAELVGSDLVPAFFGFFGRQSALRALYLGKDLFHRVCVVFHRISSHPA